MRDCEKMSEEIRHNCGMCVSHTLHDNYNFIRSLQHRGREATGMVAVGYNRIDAMKWEGAVTRFDIVDLHKIFPSEEYHTFMAHVRYATKGRKDRLLQDAHPHVIGGEIECRGDHIIIRNCEMAAVHNGQVDMRYFEGMDLKDLKTGCDTEALLRFYYEKGERELLRNIPGAYTLAIADRRLKEVIVMRDRLGIRPGALGMKDGKYCVCSEDIALRENGGDFIEDLTPGNAYYLHEKGGYRKERIVDKSLRHCFFEWNYISHLGSSLDSASVRSIRGHLGEALAKEFRPKDADFVTFLPRCPEMAARSYARAIGVEFLPVFYKMRSERSFQGPTNSERTNSIHSNLHLIPGMEDRLKGKTGVLIDDSTIRGTNASRARELLFEKASAKKIYLANYTPPIGIIGEDGEPRGCLFGVDMSPSDTFIARGRTIDEISTECGMEVFYLSTKGMLNAFKRAGIKDSQLCTFCIGGKHPFK